MSPVSRLLRTTHIQFVHIFQHRIHRRHIDCTLQRSPAQHLQLVQTQTIADALRRQRCAIGIETAIARERQLHIFQTARGRWRADPGRSFCTVRRRTGRCSTCAVSPSSRAKTLQRLPLARLLIDVSSRLRHRIQAAIGSDCQQREHDSATSSSTRVKPRDFILFSSSWILHQVSRQLTQRVFSLIRLIHAHDDAAHGGVRGGDDFFLPRERFALPALLRPSGCRVRASRRVPDAVPIGSVLPSLP